MPQFDGSGRVVRLPAVRPATGRAGGPGDVARRLAALERQVECALAASGAAPPAVPPVDAVIDGLVGGADRLRRALGGDPDATAALLEPSLDFLYHRWWRVDVIGRERLPKRGPAMVVANRAAMALPYDALILARALAAGAAAPRTVRPLVDAWLLDLPLLGPALAALGARPATLAAARGALRAGETAIVFPEGQDAIGKTVERRYRLGPFGQAALLRAAGDAGAPVVPVAVVGAEDARPVIWRIEGVGRWLGLPVLPISPVPFPLPTKWTIHVGEPMEAPAADADRDTRRAFVARLRERLQGLLSDAVGRRPGVFG